MRASAPEKAFSACARAGITTLLSRVDFEDRHPVEFVGGAGGAQDIVGGDAALLAGELVAAARPADALEDAVAHQRLQDRLQMPWRQAVARRQRLGCDRSPACIERDVNDGGDCQNAFARQERHRENLQVECGCRGNIVLLN